ncbi:polyhydroxyalkanoic acid synthase [Methylobacterium sp. Leaf399]|uniref:polyhydroxyalkanoic acid system family protein n=1 Tax=unclassified Methylobacterium TaxID=2615210 RepID=UPI0006F4EE47|nr:MULTISPECIES: polyhydroxyalkanoic acid system family protein [unclassified Methylobacterium]KQP52751.1 polyhydroxyalkanoic acid synthase [Methylobacterium sp. Leaf108]KQT11930.1 polyhydroxyalkanoic acid synthase [Methylobacterium sp. Leaf399]KQT84470.1 polyhydroxyalkanoic acid synthase [Methylobacterium sp. Leaf466]
MSKPLIVEIPHELGLAEARRRIADGVGGLDSTFKKAGIAVETMAWTEDTLAFAVAAMGQKVNGQVDVKPQTVRIEVRLPLLLSLFAQKLQKTLGNKGTLLLTKK